jgi:hypothetical protein
MEKAKARRAKEKEKPRRAIGTTGTRIGRTLFPRGKTNPRPRADF